MRAARPALVVLALLLAMQALGTFDVFDARRHDSMLRWSGVPAVSEPIVLVRIDEATLASIKAPMVLWGEELGAVVNVSVQAGAKAVATDILHFSLIGDFDPSRGYPLVGAFGAARGSGVPVVTQALQAADDSDQAGGMRPPHPMVQATVSAVGFANLTFDQDGIIRRQELGCGDVPSFALAIARQVAADPDTLPHCATVPIRYRDTGGRWPGVSMEEILAKHAAGDREWLKQQLGGKIVLIGSTAPSLDDHFVTPLVPLEGRMTPGVEVHSHVLHTLLSADAPRPLTKPIALGVMALLGVLSLAAGTRQSPRRAVVSAAVLSGSWVAVVIGSNASGVTAPVGGPLLMATAPGIIAALGRFQAERAARRKLSRTLGAYVNEHVLEAVLKDPDSAGIGGARRRITVLMADIRGYTTFAEHRAPEEVVGVLNEYFSEMTEAVQDHRGTVDKFIGDGLLAIFGAPLQLPLDGAAEALEAAFEMERRLMKLHARWRERGLPELEIGIGIHTGSGVVGNMGSARKMEYTVIGDAVNVASRIESATRRFDVRILISEDTLKMLDDRPPARDLGEVEVKGREAPIRLWTPEGLS